jgi:hypothetical protein
MGRARDILLEVGRCIQWDLMRMLDLHVKPTGTHVTQVESGPTVRLRSTRTPYLQVVESAAADEQPSSAGDRIGRANNQE